MASGGMNLEQQFVNYSKYNDTISDGKKITLTNSDIWMIQAEILDDSKITYTDTGVCFNKWKTRTITYQQFVTFLEDLAAYKKIDLVEMKKKLTDCGLPGANTTPAAKKQAANK